MSNPPKSNPTSISKPNGTAPAVWKPEQTVLVLQGGGALGAYQAGIYQGLHEAGIEPDWIIGTSIGAINASLIAGNSRDNRLPALKQFWELMAHKSPLHGWPGWERIAQSFSNWQTINSGIPGFFEPNRMAFSGGNIPLGPENAGYYSTAPLEKTLHGLVDFALINRRQSRMTVGAAHVRSSRMRYFDSRDTEINVKHILASGALPPAFPAVRIDGELYWDGGILSNTPSEVVFDDYPRFSSLIFAVHMWHPTGPEPVTMMDVLHRQKDIQYSSRVASHIARQQQTHRLRHIIERLSGHVPEAIRDSAEIRQLTDHGCTTQMHVVRLLAPRLDGEDQSKDVDFSPAGIRDRWAAGLAGARRAIAQAPWQGSFDANEGVILHEPDGRIVTPPPTGAPAFTPPRDGSPRGQPSEAA
jgi:NTE family protein